MASLVRTWALSCSQQQLMGAMRGLTMQAPRISSPSSALSPPHGLAAADAASAPCCSYSTAQYHIGSRPADPVLAPMLRWGSAAAHARQGAAGGSPHSLWLANEQQQRRQKHSIPYSARSGTSRPAPWPVFEAIKRGPTGGIRWQRTLYRFPQAVEVSLEGRQLTLSGRAGTVGLDLCQLDPSGLVAFTFLGVPGQQPMLALASPHKDRFDALVDELDVTVRGVTVGYLVGLTVKGVGYRIEPFDEKPRKRSWYFDDEKADASATIQYPHPAPVPAVRLKVGYSRTAIFPLPDSIRAFCIKPTLLYLYGLRKDEVDAAAAAISAVRKPNVYTGNGIRLVGEQVRIKQRKASK